MPITARGVDSDPKAKESYEKEINELLEEIKGKSVGKEIYGAILLTKKNLTIRPESLRPDNQRDDNRSSGNRAATFPLDPAASAPSTVSPEGTSLRDRQYAGKDDDEDTETDPATHRGDERYDTVNPKYRAKGGGSDDIIYFTPGKKSDKSCASGAGFCAANPDEILLHEMVHALREMQGVANPVPTTLRYKNEEEFLAVVVTNVYISKAKGNKFLRQEYRRTGPLEAPLNTTDGFLKDPEHKEILEYYAKFWQPIFGQLGNVQTAFNPFSKFKTPPAPRRP